MVHYNSQLNEPPSFSLSNATVLRKRRRNPKHNEKLSDDHDAIDENVKSPSVFYAFFRIDQN